MEASAEEEEAVPEAVVDMALPGWPALAAAQLRARRFARLRLTPAEADLTRRLYVATGAFYDDDAKHAVAVDERNLCALDDRSGFIASKRREMYELHGRSEPAERTLGLAPTQALALTTELTLALAPPQPRSEPSA